MTSVDLAGTAAAVGRVQLSDGSIPWEPGRHVDPWDHVEAAMGLDVAGHHGAARRAYAWMSALQRADGAWAAAYLDGRVFDATLDANFVAYAAPGILHHALVTGDDGFLDRNWRMVDRALDFVLGLQAPEGPIYWARDGSYRPWPGALLTSSSCIYLSLRCALEVARRVGESRPDWELALDLLGGSLTRPELFEPKDRYSMDWYYPVLCGAVRGEDARLRLEERWDEFVIDGWGCLCVADRPWVTTGETCELVLACLVADMCTEAEVLFEWVHQLRAPDDLYWTGVNLPDETPWPNERTTWSAGAVLLAADAFDPEGPTRTMLRAGPEPVPRIIVPASLHGAPSATP